MNDIDKTQEQLINELSRLRQRTNELETNALQRDEELDALAHSIVHDVRAPLAYMVGLTHVLEQDHTALSGKDLRHYLSEIAGRGHRMSQVIDKLLLLAGVRKIKEIPMNPLNMGDIVVEALERLADPIDKHQAELILPDAWPTALGYNLWVEEVWVNYIGNAIKYGGHPPRVELGFSTLDSGFRISDCPSTSQNWVCFWVRDNGHGLTREEQARLFTPLTRLDKVHTRGHGLGLSIVRRIVEKLGGQVKVDSESGQGSTFSFFLPGAQA